MELERRSRPFNHSNDIGQDSANPVLISVFVLVLVTVSALALVDEGSIESLEAVVIISCPALGS